MLLLLIEIFLQLAIVELRHNGIGLTQSSMSQPRSKLAEVTEECSAIFMITQKRKENVYVYPIKAPEINKHFRHNLIIQLGFGQDTGS